MSIPYRFNRTKLGYGLIFLLALCAVAPLPYSRIEQFYEKQHLLKLQQIVHLIQNGTLKPDKSGDITLPSHFAYLTQNGHVYLSRNPKQPLILFPEQIIKYDVEWQTGLPQQQRRPTEHKLNIEGYVYSQVPLPKDWSVGVDDPAVAGVFAEIPPRQMHWYYAQPMPLDW